MDVNSMLELIGVRPREAKSAEVNRLPTDPNASLMDIVNRNQQPGAIPAAAPPDMQNIDAMLSNLERQHMMNQNQERQSIGRTEAMRDRAARSLTIAETRAEQARRRAAPGSRQDLFIPIVDPQADLSLRGPGPTPAAPQYASLDRAGPPMTGPQEQPVFLPSSGTDIGAMVGQLAGGVPTPGPAPAPSVTQFPTQTPIDFSLAPNIQAPPDPTMAALAPFVAQTPPPDPFASVSPQVGPTGSPTTTPPAPTPDYLLPPRNVGQRPPFPFSTPSAAMRLALPAAEGPSALDQLRAVPQPPTEAFAPDGQVINWWNSGQGRSQPAPTAQRPQPTTAGLRRAAPTPTPGPDQSTILNQQELQRFLSANPGNPSPPPTPATTPPTPLASAPAPAPTPIPAGVTPMSPAAPPSMGAQVPPALQEQLLSEAYRLVAQRNNPNPGAPTR